MGNAENRPGSWLEILERRAAERPEQEVFTFLADGATEAGTLRFRDLEAQARAVAGALGARRVVAGERALLLYEPGLAFIPAFLGCLLAGVIAVPAPVPDLKRPERALPRLRAIVADAKPAVILATGPVREGLRDVLAEALGALPWIATDQVALVEGWRPEAVSREAIAHLQYTSGSTGAPKGVVLTHANLLHGSESIRQSASYGTESVCLAWVPHLHDYGLIEGILQPLYSGARAYLMPPAAFVAAPLRWLAAISRYGVTHTGGPDFAYDLAVRRVAPEAAETLDLSRWRWALNAAEPIRPATLRRFVARYAKSGFRMESFQPAYGLAEATLQVTNRAGVRFLAAPDDGRERAGSGFPALDTQILIVDPASGSPCEGKAIGEIWVRGPGVAAGYYRQPERTAEVFGARLASGEGPYLRTGDLGFLHDGELFVTGRSSDLMILRGQNHHPQDVEWALDDLARTDGGLRVGANAAFSVEEDSEERLVIVAEVAPGVEGAGLIDRVCEAVAARLALRPWAVVLVAPGTLPRTTSGKRMRSAVKQAFLEEKLRVVASWRLDRPGAPSATEGGEVNTRLAALERLIAAHVSALVGAQHVALDRPFAALGMDSVRGVQLVHDLQQDPLVGAPLSPVLLWDFPTVGALARHLAGLSPEPSAARAPALPSEPIAVVGLGCRFPGAESPEALWRMLHDGIDAIGEVPAGRWPAEVPALLTRQGGFLPEIDLFDSEFFQISPREADRMDPQQRLVLEVATEALEHAGLMPSTLEGTRTGVFLGISAAEYAQLTPRDQLDAYSGTGNLLSIAAGRLAWHLGIHGPTLAVDTACSSSLVAIHLAMRSLRSGECALALAGGVNLMVTPDASVIGARLHALSPTGRCHSFDARADGYVRGEGCGMVALKRLSDAMAEGDRVLAVLRGSAILHDGRSNGLTAPNGLAQQQVLRDALADAGVRAEAVQVIEAHGTGTPLGDPIEAAALGAVFGEGRTAPLLLGSVKTNLGHLEAAAGVAGLIKTVLALQHGLVPASLHFATPNPHIRWESLPLRVVAERTPWPAGARRIAGVSAFGLSGTNAHVVVEGVDPPPSTPTDGPVLIRLSARTEGALQALAGRYAALLRQPDAPSLADLAHTAATGRTAYDERLAFVAHNPEEARAKLRSVASGAGREHRGQARTPRVAFLFTGQGSVYAGMGRDLYQGEPIYRAAIDRCAAILGEPFGAILRGEDPRPLDSTALAQPALLALQHGLVSLWRSWGVEPVAVLGHSVGEYAAALCAGVWTLEEALGLVAARGRLMAETAPGVMAAVEAEEEELLPLLGDAEIAACNGPMQVVISGTEGAVRACLARLAARGVRTHRLDVNRGFHSHLLEPMLSALAARVPLGRRPSVPLISNLTGRVESEILRDPTYWAEHARRPVRFEQGLETLLALGVDALVEVGPQPVLLGLAPSGPLRLPSLRRDGGRAGTLESAGRLWVQGAPVSPNAGAVGRKGALPTYPFQRRRHWVETAPAAHPASSGETGSLAGTPLHLPGPILHQVVPLGLRLQPWLAWHRVHGEIIAPGALLVAVVLAVARARLKLGAATLSDILFLRALALPSDHTVDLHLDLEPRAGGHTFRLSTREPAADPGAEPVWRTHMEGRLSPEAVALPAPSLLSALEAAPEALDVEGFYRRLGEAHIDLAPPWRWVDQARRGAETVVAHLQPRAETQVDSPLHPILLDSAFGAMLAGQILDGPAWGEAPFLPWAIASLRWLGTPSGPVWSAGRVRQAEDTRTCELSVWEEGRGLRVQVEGLVFRRASSDAFLRAPARARPAPLPMTAVIHQNGIEGLVQGAVARVIGATGPLASGRPLKDLGMDSLMAVELREALSEATGLSLPATLAFDRPTIDDLVAFLAEKLGGEPAPAPLQPRPATGDAIAIIGVSCRLPGGAETPETYWALLREGRDAVIEVPRTRWDNDAFFASELGRTGTLYSRWAGLLTSDIEGFDAGFFGVRAREARAMDPQQRLLLEGVWEALERAGIAPDSLSGSRTGVFVGLAATDYVHRQLIERGTGWIDAFTATGNAPSIASGRISYLLGLQGPCLTLDTACSSSLVALHLARQSLAQGECDLAIVAGVNLLLGPLVSIYFSQLNALSSGPHCRTFDAAADGYVRGEGCGVLVLKRHRDAVEAGDPVVALVTGSAVSQDGRTNGLTAPSGPAQERVIREALQSAGLRPEQIDYVEAHGTGTPLGDPIEANALGAVFDGRDRPLWVGSVKTNLGHLEAAAGVAGLLKVALAMEHGQIPPHLHFQTPSPHVPWARLPLRVPTQLTPWPPGPRRAGISSFGFSGTNAHIILEVAPAAPAPLPSAPARPRHLLTLSADTPAALVALAARFADHLRATPALPLAEVCFSANTGRAQREHRLVVTAGAPVALVEALEAFAASRPAPSLRVGRAARFGGFALRSSLVDPPFQAWPAFRAGGLVGLFSALGVPPREEAAWVLSLDGEPWSALLDALATLVVAGAPLDWRAWDAPWARRRVLLPTTPFQRERCWFERGG